MIDIKKVKEDDVLMLEWERMNADDYPEKAKRTLGVVREVSGEDIEWESGRERHEGGQWRKAKDFRMNIPKFVDKGDPLKLNIKIFAVVNPDNEIVDFDIDPIQADSKACKHYGDDYHAPKDISWGYIYPSGYIAEHLGYRVVEVEIPVIERRRDEK